MEARDWLKSQSPKTQARFGVLFERLANGAILNKEQYRQLDDEVWEFKRDGDRIFCFVVGRLRLLTHHMKKKQQKTPRREIDRARRIGEEHVEWVSAQRRKKR